MKSLFVGPKFEPLEARALYGKSAVADGLGQKYFGPEKDWPISADPVGAPSALYMRLPFACRGNMSCDSTVTAAGYSIPVKNDKATKSIIPVFNALIMSVLSN